MIRDSSGPSRWIAGLILAALTILSAGPATALTAADVRAHLASDDLDAMETAFVRHQERFARHGLEDIAYLAPYAVFATTDPAVQDAARRWLKAHPGSPHAMTAVGRFLTHSALLFRGKSYGSDTPSGALTEMQRRLNEAIPLFIFAIDAEPSHLAAAYGLRDAASFAGDTLSRGRALGVIRAWAEHDHATVAGLHLTYPRWGGASTDTFRHCTDRTSTPKQLTFELCMAIADFEQTASTKALRLLAEGPRSLLGRFHVEALARDGKWEEAVALAQATGTMTVDLGWRAWRHGGDSGPLERAVAVVLAVDPYEPDALAALARLKSQNADPEGARAAWEKAMAYGRYRPEIRRDRLFAMARGEKYAEMLSALEETDWNMVVLGYAVQLLGFTDTPFAEADVRRADFACKRLRILEQHERACERDDWHQSCRHTKRRDTVIANAREEGACGERPSVTWQDWLRRKLDLDD